MKNVFILILIFLIAGVVGWNKVKIGREKNVETGKIQITASFYPLYFFAKEIGGDRVEVASLVPAGVEPHDYEPTAGDIAKISESKLLILNGGGFEAWGEKIKGEIKDAGVKVLEVGEGLIEDNDPHIWLSPEKTKTIAKVILEKLVEIDPGSEAVFNNNYKNLIVKISDLQAKYKNGLAVCKTNEFVTSHDAFGYLAKEFGLTQIAISGLSPDEEPSIKELAVVADMAKKNGVRYIFFETLVSPRLAETVATEIGAQTLVLDPIEGIEAERQQQGVNYFTIMEENLTNLRTALECQ